MSDFHQPVMAAEVLDYLRLKPGDNVIDCTLGGAGHVLEYLKQTAPDGKVLGIDLDPLAISVATKATKKYGQRVKLVQDNFKNIKKIAQENGFDHVNGIVLDLGLSSGQLQDQKRGFSFLADGALDMRFGGQTDVTAYAIVNSYGEQQLVDIFRKFGEERLARPIAQKIITNRKIQPITTPQQLVEIITEAYKKYFRQGSKVNPATKVFQALRIAVNGELENLVEVLPQTVSILKPGGRIVVISYHSLEDRIVKDFFRQEIHDCICPPEMPVCQCDHKKSVQIITKKPIIAGNEELALNPRARSAKLRVAEKT